MDSVELLHPPYTSKDKGKAKRKIVDPLLTFFRNSSLTKCDRSHLIVHKLRRAPVCFAQSVIRVVHWLERPRLSFLVIVQKVVRNRECSSWMYLLLYAKTRICNILPVYLSIKLYLNDPAHASQRDVIVNIHRTLLFRAWSTLNIFDLRQRKVSYIVLVYAHLCPRTLPFAAHIPNRARYQATQSASSASMPVL